MDMKEINDINDINMKLVRKLKTLLDRVSTLLNEKSPNICPTKLESNVLNKFCELNSEKI